LRRESVARSVLGKLPEGPFAPHQVIPSLRRLMMSGLLESAWPTLTVQGDSTVLSFEVRERPALAIGPAFTLGNDEGGRAYLGMPYRRERGPWPAVVTVGAAWTKLGGSIHGSLEPFALDHGSYGWFIRGRYHDREARLFDGGHEVGRISTHRGESFFGGQVG